MYPEVQPCEVCGKVGTGRGVIDRHHRNSDRLDNRPENIAFLCRRHHHAAHRLTDGRVGGGPRPRIAAAFRVAAIERYETALRLERVGLTYRQIADVMGYDVESVRRWFRKYVQP